MKHFNMLIKSTIVFIVSIFILQFSVIGCAGDKKLAHNIISATFSPDNTLCLQDTSGFELCKIDTSGKIVNCQRIEIPEVDDAFLIAADAAHNKYFYAAADSVFMFDRTTGLTRTMTRGAFAENARCARVSPDGKFLAFSASKWELGNISYWRLVVVDAVEGGIIHYCDSLVSLDAFQWVGSEKLGYAELWNANGKFDTLGMFFNTKRRVVIPTRDRAIDFLKIPCNPNLSYDGVWFIDIVDSVANVEKLHFIDQNIQNP
ncbi:hypothetical protein J7L68_06425 [bacterium]|nr:hypothetical protein [bacterium]